ncbi:MAG: hypothetical protein ACKOPG_07905 [Novosphingobium sp.]
MQDTAICTWFVADDAATATFFPQVGSRSDAPATQAVYWRCTACFFASSLAVNPKARHLFFTNTRIPTIDGVDLGQLLACWGVKVIELPITYRLPLGIVGSWGNQFYIFDVLDWFSVNSPAQRVIVLDSDCLWLRPVDEMARTIDHCGALTYELGGDEHPEDSAINGLSRAEMALFLAAQGGAELADIPYFGGEIFAASIEVTRRIAMRGKALWPQVLCQVPNAPREEAHLLSIIYALEGIKRGTANAFIRRMWTTFHHHNLARSDRDLAIWHLPAEKKTGFADMFASIAASPHLHPARDQAGLGLTREHYARAMGWPRRRPWKLVRDLGLKLVEKLGRRG